MLSERLPDPGYPLFSLTHIVEGHLVSRQSQTLNDVCQRDVLLGSDVARRLREFGEMSADGWSGAKRLVFILVVK